MKIGISLLSARACRSGVENVAFNLIRQLSTVTTGDEYVVFANTRYLPWLPELAHRIPIIDVHPSAKRAFWVWEHNFFLTDGRVRELDLVHFPIGGGVIGYRGKFVITIHDLKHYLQRRQVRLHRHLLWRLWCNANIRRAARIITISDHVKQDLLREFPEQAHNVHVIYNGIDSRFMPGTPSLAFRAKYHLPDKYVLFVGSTSKNKNLMRAIDAIGLLSGTMCDDCKFIVAGLPGEEDRLLRQHVHRKNLSDRVRFLGYVSDDDLPDLYRHAELFLFPSLTEGFGIPPLEAMRSGIPVVAARSSSLPEILGDAPIWVDPLSSASIADGIRIGLFDASARNRATVNGYARAELFSWSRMALQTAELYREAILSR